MTKTKEIGIGERYADSLYYEWFIIMDDATEFSMFDDTGDDTMWRDVLDYSPAISNIKKVGLRAFSQAKADLINSHQGHQYTVIVSTRKDFSVTLSAPQKGFVPYMMKRKQIYNGYIQTFYVVGLDTDGDQFFIVNNNGDFQQGDNKLLVWV